MPLSAVESLVHLGQNAINAATLADTRHRVAALQAACKNIHLVFEDTPDPAENEKAFMGYMAQHGPTMNTLLSDLQLCTDAVVSAMTAETGEPSDLADEVAEARDLHSQVMQIISIYTMLSLLRYKGIASPSERHMHSSLAAVVAQLDGIDGGGCPPAFLEEAHALLAAVGQSSTVKGGRR